MSQSDEPQSTTKNAPSHFAYQVRDSGPKAHWTRIGAAWAHKDGQGYSIFLDCMPRDGHISLRANTDRVEQ